MPSTPDCRRITIVYDGQCPVCSHLMSTYQALIRRKIEVELIDARSEPDFASDFRRATTIDLNNDFAVRIGANWWHGHEAAALLVQLASEGAVTRKLSDRFAKPIYAVLRGGRRVLLFLLRRPLLKTT